MIALSLILVLSIPAVSLRAQDGPIAKSARAALVQGSGQASSGKAGMFWAGIALMGAGATMSILANTALRKEECFFSLTFFFCEESPNKAMWATGAAIGATGGILTAIGASRSIVIGPNRVGYRLSF